MGHTSVRQTTTVEYGPSQTPYSLYASLGRSCVGSCDRSTFSSSPNLMARQKSPSSTSVTSHWTLPLSTITFSLALSTGAVLTTLIPVAFVNVSQCTF